MSPIKVSHNLLKSSSSSIISNFTGRAINSVTVIDAGVMTFKCEVICDDDQIYIVRFYPVSRSDIINFEPDVINRCYEHGAKVCQVITDSRKSPENNLNFMAYKKLPGVALSDRFYSLSKKEQTLIIDDISENIKIIQNVKMNGYGELVNSFKAKNSSWLEFINMVAHENIPYLEKLNLINRSNLYHLINSLLNNRLALADVLPRLIWADVSLDNIIIDDNNRLSGFIDFEACLSGDNLLTFGYLFAREGESSFYKMLVKQCVDRGEFRQDLIDFYAILRILRIIKFYSKPLPTGKRRDAIDSFFPGFQKAIKRYSEHK